MTYKDMCALDLDSPHFTYA